MFGSPLDLEAPCDKPKIPKNPNLQKRKISNFSPFSETIVVIKSEVESTRQEILANINDFTFMNACYIKSAYQENGDPFGLIIASCGPQEYNVDNFWKMVYQNNVTKVVSMCQDYTAPSAKLAADADATSKLLFANFDAPETCEYVPNLWTRAPSQESPDTSLQFGDLTIHN